MLELDGNSIIVTYLWTIIGDLFLVLRDLIRSRAVVNLKFITEKLSCTHAQRLHGLMIKKYHAGGGINSHHPSPLYATVYYIDFGVQSYLEIRY